MSGHGWIGVDLDGTLAHYEQWTDHRNIGAPIPAMIERVQRWLTEGKDVRIFTARANATMQPLYLFVETCSAIEAWCLEHIGQILPITNSKDYQMVELWDDRCVQVVTNTGEIVGQSTRGLE